MFESAFPSFSLGKSQFKVVESDFQSPESMKPLDFLELSEVLLVKLNLKWLDLHNILLIEIFPDVVPLK